MKSTIAYLYDWGGTLAGDDVQQIDDAFANECLIVPTLDHSMDPRIIKNEIDALVARLFNENDPIIVGTGAGGFWADYAAAKYGIKAVLINPQLRPYHSMRCYSLPESYYTYYNVLRDSMRNVSRKCTMIVQCGSDLSRAIDVIRSSVGNYPEQF